MGSIHLFRDLPEVKPYPAGELIFREGEPGKTMYLVIEGEIDLVVGRAVVETAKPGTFIGELVLIDDAPRSAAARAKTDCRIFPIDEERFRSLVQSTPSFVLDVMKGLALRLRRTNSRIGGRSAAGGKRRAHGGTPAPRRHRK
jgi:CRP/FNR family transcriptional regulator, cyclic AMP receptor protein